MHFVNQRVGWRIVLNRDANRDIYFESCIFHKALNSPPDISFFHYFIPQPLIPWESQKKNHEKCCRQESPLYGIQIFRTRQRNPLVVFGIESFAQGSKLVLQTFSSCISLFPGGSFYEKVNFCQKWSFRQEAPLRQVQNSIFVHRALKCFLWVKRTMK